MSGHSDKNTDLPALAREVQYRAAKLARLYGVNRRTLHRHVKMELNATLRDWLLALKRRDAEALRGQGKTLKELTDAFGFHHEGSLCRMLHRPPPGNSTG